MQLKYHPIVEYLRQTTLSNNISYIQDSYYNNSIYLNIYEIVLLMLANMVES